MLVSDLSPGDLVMPAERWFGVIRTEDAHSPDGPVSISAIRFLRRDRTIGLSSNAPSRTWIYLGCESRDYTWDGCWKHHLILADDHVLHLSGYDVRYLDPCV